MKEFKEFKETTILTPAEEKVERDMLISKWAGEVGRHYLFHQYNVVVDLLCTAYGDRERINFEKKVFDLMEAGREAGLDSGIKIGLARAEASIH